MSTPTRPPAPLVALFFVQGVGMLFPWNALLSSFDFYLELFKADSYVKSTFFKHAIIAYLSANYVTTALALLPMAKRTEQALTISSFIFQCLVFATLLIINIMSDTNVDIVLLQVVMFLVFIVAGSATAIIQSNLFSISGKLHFSCSTWMLFGQGIAGITASLVSAIIAHVNLSPAPTANIYFATCLVVMALSLAAYFLLPAYVSAELLRINSTTEPGTSSTTMMASPITAASDDTTVDKNAAPISNLAKHQQQEQLPAIKPKPYSTFELFKRVYPFALFLVLDFAIMLTVYPTLTSKLSGALVGENQRKLYYKWTFVVFNVFDSAGRFVPALAGTIFAAAATWYARRSNLPEPPRATQKLRKRVMAAVTLLRPLFLVLFPLCFIAKDGDKDVKKPWVGSPITDNFTPMFLIALLALSTGALATSCFVYSQNTQFPVAPGSAIMRDMLEVERSKTGRIMTFSLLTGLVLGSLLKELYAYIVLVG